MSGLLFQEALDYAESRRVVLPSDYFGAVNAAHRAQSVSISGMSELNQIKFVIDQLNKTLREGVTFNSFKKAVEDNTLGIDLPKYRLDNIFRTNIQTAYNKGRQEQQERTESPYLMYDAVNDSRTRPTHRSWDNLVLSKDNPFWQTHYPPNGYRCRCIVVSLSRKQAERRGIKSGPDTNLPPDPGFEGSPDTYQEAQGNRLRKSANEAEMTTRTSVSGRITKSLEKVRTDLAASKILGDLTIDASDSVTQLEVLRALSMMGKKIKTVTPIDATIALSYTKEGKFQAINELMRKESFTEPERLVITYLASLFKALESKFPNKQTVLYRGLDAEKIIPLLAETHAKGSIVELGSLQSTSLKIGVAYENFGEIDQALITVIGASGVGIDMKAIALNPTEAEVLLVPGTKYKVLRYVDDVDLSSGRHKINIEVEVVPKSSKSNFVFEKTHQQPYSASTLRLWGLAEEKI